MKNNYITASLLKGVSSKLGKWDFYSCIRLFKLVRNIFGSILGQISVNILSHYDRTVKCFGSPHQEWAIIVTKGEFQDLLEWTLWNESSYGLHLFD